jgi:hypothetical protein
MAMDSFVTENNLYDLFNVVVSVLDVKEMVVDSNPHKKKD